MVPYINFPYAEHLLKQVGVTDPNAKAADKDIEVLVRAAKECQALARSLENQDSIKGFLIYQDKPEPAQSDKKGALPIPEIPGSV